jgi:putative tryptophan/tyrosine transport system substrate-binding protein
MLKRRLLVAGVAADALVWPLAVRAQAPARVPRIGYLNLRSGPIAQELGMQLLVFDAATADELAGVFAATRREQAQAQQIDPLSNDRSRDIVELAARHRLPAMYDIRLFVDGGGLVSYGPSIAHSCRHAASCVEKILRGARAADLPVEQPTRFELVINLGTVRTLGLTIPKSLLPRADEVTQ